MVFLQLLVLFMFTKLLWQKYGTISISIFIICISIIIISGY